MCYSAIVEAAFKKFIKKRGAIIDFALFEKLYRMRFKNKSIKIPRGMDANFLDPQSPIEKRIKEAIDEWDALQRTEMEKGLFEQRTRLTSAERELESKSTKALLNEQRIATNKIARFKEKLDELNAPPPNTGDVRLYPLSFAPVFVMEDDKLVVKPMRYHCRPRGKPESIDRQLPGLFNARRDSLEKWWDKMFGANHGMVIATAFFENVSLEKFEHRELKQGEKPQNLILKFEPQPKTEMLLACVWDLSGFKEDEQFLSFAAVTDEPPAEVAAAGHDRCVIPLKEENLKAWLTPVDRKRPEFYSILDDRERPFYEHRKAA